MYKFVSCYTQFLFAQFFKSLPKNKGAIDIQQLQRCGSGGTHDIFQDPSHPEYVLKVYRPNINASQVELDLKCKELTAQYAVLYGVFGAENCMVEHHFISLVTPREGRIDRAIMSVQKYDTCFQEPSKLDFQPLHLELQNIDVEAQQSAFLKYNRVAWGYESFSADDVSYLAIDPKIEALYNKTKEDIGFNQKLTDFLKRCRRYYQQTGVLIDLSGVDNVLFFQRDSRWILRVGSVIKNETKTSIQQAVNELSAGVKTLDDLRETRTQIESAMPRIRALNVMALALGLDPVVDDIHASEYFLTQLQRFSELCTDIKLNRLARKGHFDSVFKALETFNAADQTYVQVVRILVLKRVFEFAKEPSQHMPFERGIRTILYENPPSESLIQRLNAGEVIQAFKEKYPT